MEIIKIIDCLSGTEHRDVLVKVHDQDKGIPTARPGRGILESYYELSAQPFAKQRSTPGDYMPSD